MNKDQQAGDSHCLVGKHFTVGGEIYVVAELTVRETGTVVEAHNRQDNSATRRFFLPDVLERLMVEEEIELFSPNYLTAR